jgi:hypothetical protein
MGLRGTQLTGSIIYTLVRRSLLKLLGVVIDVGKGNIRFISPPCNSHVFPRVKSKGKKGRRKASVDPNTSSLDTT